MCFRGSRKKRGGATQNVYSLVGAGKEGGSDTHTHAPIRGCVGGRFRAGPCEQGLFGVARGGVDEKPNQKKS